MQSPKAGDDVEESKIAEAFDAAFLFSRECKMGDVFVTPVQAPAQQAPANPFVTPAPQAHQPLLVAPPIAANPNPIPNVNQLGNLPGQLNFGLQNGTPPGAQQQQQQGQPAVEGQPTRLDFTNENNMGGKRRKHKKQRKTKRRKSRRKRRSTRRRH